MKKYLLLLATLASVTACQSQILNHETVFAHEDTLRGSITTERLRWNVLKYDIWVQPDYTTKSITAKNTITYYDSGVYVMQIDLQQPLIIDSIYGEDGTLAYKQQGNVCHVYVRDTLAKYKIKPGPRTMRISYHGTPREAINPPWDGGWIWKKDAAGNPWMSVACQGLGASVWYPCKDHQSDEPDSGAVLSITVPDTLVAVGNGRLVNTVKNNGLATYTWQVTNPINSYNVIPYIGKYVNFTETFNGELGNLDVSYWVLEEDLEKAKQQFTQVKPMLTCFEHWFGPYPFYEDSYKLVESPHLGMEHQSAVAYGNKFMNGYLGKDLSGTGWGLKWDYIIIHESGHEWFANNITSNDIADMWVHEGFTDYSETLFTECQSGKDAANEYNYGQRKGIQNKTPIIGMYGVNREGSGDMYPKGANLIHTLRHAINDDEKFRNILRGLNKTFWHQTVDTKQVEDYISQQSGINFSKVFDQYLRNTSIPVLEYYFSNGGKKMHYKWSNCIEGFNLPVVLHNNNAGIKFTPTTQWQTMRLSSEQQKLVTAANIQLLYYVTAKKKE
ncbi:M1 family metallopeptidase [Foetidibacter luteolus]|uniref:M1 family metallopeptidase n=1 Tax=Foetidibacter luteolus TaxID=2608880 RepID=UPI00129A20CA|nr:M1 family metallopeptidase [Foetidibacter luteolus]